MRGAVVGRGRHEHELRGAGGAGTHALLAVEHPAARRRARARVRGRSGSAEPRVDERGREDRVAARERGQPALALRVACRRARSASPAEHERGSTGHGRDRAPELLRAARRARAAPSPMPPCASGTAMPSRFGLGERRPERGVDATSPSRSSRLQALGRRPPSRGCRARGRGPRVCSSLKREVHRRQLAAGRKSGSFISSSTLRCVSCTRMPMWTSSGLQPTTFETMRVPSSSSITAHRRAGSRSRGSAGGAARRSCTPCRALRRRRRPTRSTGSSPHIGRGGWRSVAALAAASGSAARRASTPSHHQPLSCPRGGAQAARLRRRAAGARGAAACGCCAGLNFSTRNEHRADFFAVLVAEDGARVDEVADAERGRLLLGDRLDDGRRGDAVAGAQIARVVLLAVGRDDRRVAVLARAARAAPSACSSRIGGGVGHLDAAQDPGLQHRRRRDDPAVHGCAARRRRRGRRGCGRPSPRTSGGSSTRSRLGRGLRRARLDADVRLELAARALASCSCVGRSSR